MNHTEARKYVVAAFRGEFSEEPPTSVAQMFQAIGGLETGYGSGWHGSGVGSFNMGAIQAGASWTGATFSYTDTHPMPDGTNKPYTVAFRKYPDPTAGFADLCEVLFRAFDREQRVLVAAEKGDVLAFSTELHKYPCYYEGFGATDADRIAHHYNAVLAQIRLQCAELNETLPTLHDLPTVTPALLLGSKGPAVGAWQSRALGFKGSAVDDDFGMATQTATRVWQVNHHLPASGIVCEQDLVIAGLRPTPLPPP